MKQGIRLYDNTGAPINASNPLPIIAGSTKSSAGKYSQGYRLYSHDGLPISASNKLPCRGV